MPQKGGKRATFAGTSYVTNYVATPLLSCGCVNFVKKRRETNSHNHLFIKNLRRKHGFPNFQRSRKNVAFRSTSRMQSGPNSGSLQEGRSKHWPCRKPTQRPASPAGDQAWFNSRMFAGDKSGVAGVELATASEPPGASLGSGGVALRASTPATPSCDLRLNHARLLV